MKNTKLLKAYCRNTGQHFCFEMAKISGSWKAVNMIWLTNDESKIICSEINQPEYYSHTNLLPCLHCGNRKLGGCKCSPKVHPCTKGMKYQFDCAYCSELVWDYSRSNNSKTPYTKWAGISNIPNAIKDKYGNPEGSQYDLAQDEIFNGDKIVILNLCTAKTATLNCVKKALNNKGFSVAITIGKIPSPTELQKKLSSASQLWIISQEQLQFTPKHYDVIKEFFDAGHGLYIWGDNDPLNTNANYLIEKLFNSHLSGNYFARKVLGIQKSINGPGIIANHLISTGLISFFEGDSIAKVKLTKNLEPLIYSSDGNIVTAFYDKNGKRALIDGAFTRLWDGDWGQTAGTARYIVNAACWLANIEHFGFQQ